MWTMSRERRLGLVLGCALVVGSVYGGEPDHHGGHIADVSRLDVKASPVAMSELRVIAERTSRQAADAAFTSDRSDTSEAQNRARRQTESVSIVSTSGVLTQTPGSFSTTVAFSTAMTAGTANVRCTLRAWMPDGSRGKIYEDVVVELQSQSGTVTCTFTNYVGTQNHWDNSMPVLW